MKDASAMKMLRPKTLCAVATAALIYAFFAQPARADRAPQEERGRIEQTLRDLGFHSCGGRSNWTVANGKSMMRNTGMARSTN
jgi:hypothetical protein